MQHIYITYKTAKLAKEKGLEQDIHSYPKYSNQNNLEYSNYKDGISASTQSQLQKWLREEHNLHIANHLVVTKDKRFKIKVFYQFCICFISIKVTPDIFISKKFINYETGLEIALQEALKLISLSSLIASN